MLVFFFPEGKAAPLRERPVRPAGCVVLGLPPTHPHNMDLGLFPRVFGEGCVSDVFNQSSWKCSHGISLTPSPAMPGLLCFQTLLSQQQFRVSFLSEAPFFCILEPPLMHCVESPLQVLAWFTGLSQTQVITTTFLRINHLQCHWNAAHPEQRTKHSWFSPGRDSCSLGDT